MQDRALSVIVASGAGGAFLGRCLDSLREQAAAHGAEVIVVDRCGGEVADRIARDHPFVTLVRADAAAPRPSVPELRAMGVERASGRIVAILEEHCVAPPHWVEAILNNFREDDAAIGGPILDDNYARNQDWVVYFSEYHNYLPPWPAGERLALNGANVAYRRDAVLRHREALDKGYWEVELHPLLAREGAFRAVPEMGAHHTGPFDYGYYLRQRYLLSRVWGGMQRGKVGTARRLAYLVTAPALPLLLLGRVAQRVRQSGRYGREFRRAVPLLIPVLVVYVWGESTGYLLGAGRALELVE